MPLVNTWIKNEDWDKYYQLASKKQWGEFIHSALNNTDGWQKWSPTYTHLKPVKTPKDKFSNVRVASHPDEVPLDKIKDGSNKSPQAPKVIKTPTEAKTVVQQFSAFSKQGSGVCKIHGTSLDDRGKCLVKGCKNG